MVTHFMILNKHYKNISVGDRMFFIQVYNLWMEQRDPKKNKKPTLGITLQIKFSSNLHIKESKIEILTFKNT